MQCLPGPARARDAEVVVEPAARARAGVPRGSSAVGGVGGVTRCRTGIVGGSIAGGVARAHACTGGGEEQAEEQHGGVGGGAHGDTLVDQAVPTAKGFLSRDRVRRRDAWRVGASESDADVSHTSFLIGYSLERVY